MNFGVRSRSTPRTCSGCGSCSRGRGKTWRIHMTLRQALDEIREKQRQILDSALDEMAAIALTTCYPELMPTGDVISRPFDLLPPEAQVEIRNCLLELREYVAESNEKHIGALLERHIG